MATVEQAQEVHAAIREHLTAQSAELAEKTPVLYGGSVKADNAADLLGCKDIDGALVEAPRSTRPASAKIVQAIP